MTERDRSICFDGLTAKIVGIAGEAALVLYEKKSVQTKPLYNNSAVILTLASLASLTVISLKTGNRGGFGSYSALFFTFVFSQQALSCTKVLDSTAELSQNGSQSLLQKYRLSTFFPSKMRSYNLGDGSVMYLQPASEATLDKQDSLTSLGLNVLAFGKVKFSYCGFISRPMIVADSDIGTHVILSTKHNSVIELVDSILANKDDVQPEEKDITKWISYNFKDNDMDDDSKCNNYPRKHKVYFNTYGAVTSPNFSNKTEVEPIA